nr:putative 1-acyl-sn-glycerol-3-phosphate acyltransferase [uncultured bacterium]
MDKTTHRDQLKFDFEPAPELPGSDRLSKVMFSGIRRITNRMWDFTVEGRENIPADGPALITPNHLSFCDSIFVPAALPRRVWAIGKGEYMDSWKTKHIFPALGMIPVDRGGGDAAQAALDTAAKVLDDGRLFMIYPEGTRSRSENLHKGRTGAARLAIRCNAPIVPVGHSGTLAIQPPDSVMLKRNLPVAVRFGRPMWAHEFGDPADPRTLRAFTDAVMFEIAQLSGQRYVDRYAHKDDTPGVLADLGSDAERSAQPAAPKTPGSKPARERHDLIERITPTRPSVVGTSPMTIPRPPTRPTAHGADSIGTSNSGAKVDESPVSVPSGRARSTVG